MNKKYLLLFVCGLLLSFTNAMAAVGNGVIKIKTNASKGQKIKMEMFIFGGWDEDGDALDNSPVYGDNFSVDGASNVTAAGNKVVMTADGPEITIHGDVDYLSIVGQGVTYIDVSKATELYELRVNENPITSIDLSNAPRLKVFWASYCKDLTTVNLENTRNLTAISLQGTQITALNLSNSPNISTLNVGENQNLRTIDVTKLLALEELWVNGNGIENLDVSENPNLERLECSQNSLTKLDVSHNPRIEFLSCWGNKLAGESMDKLIASLVKETEGNEREFCVYNKLYDKEHNSLTVKQAKAVKERGWTPKQATGTMDFFTWQAFDGDDATGINTATISHAADNVWYDLSGRRVAKPTQKGIYIHGGKKVVIR
ncbi:leucine-rich repeat domain-containing protein [Prevotella nigrescens]|uniref:leucine-rich repeat domain-containing protein n=1 Tax=Prevotella nigrescens TaxID=28133 RepID=UPI0028EDF3D7|nr:leucine-rich repeat domain-containing protein [Prevotella nigrescens]